MKSIEVCLGALVFYPQYAGPAVRFKRYAPGLRRFGIRLRVFSGLWDGASNSETRGVNDQPVHVVDGIPIHGVPLSIQRGRRRPLAVHSRALAAFCERNRGTVDLVQLLYVSHWGLEGLLRLRRARIPIVYTHTMLEPVTRTLKARLKRLYATLPYRLLDCIVVSSGVMRDALREAGVAGRIEIIPNGVDVRRFRPLPHGERSTLRHRLGLDPDAEVILFLGGFLHKRKGVDVLAAAWKHIVRVRPRAQLVLVGPHETLLRPQEAQIAFVREVRQVLAESGAENRVILTGEISNVEDYLQTADVFAFPSRMEGMPNAVAEAFASGAATVMAPFIGLPEEFGKAGTHYVLVERTANAFADAIIDLLDNPRRRQHIAWAARRWVEEQLDVERSLERYASLYHELVERAQGRNNG